MELNRAGRRDRHTTAANRPDGQTKCSPVMRKERLKLALVAAAAALDDDDENDYYCCFCFCGKISLACHPVYLLDLLRPPTIAVVLAVNSSQRLVSNQESATSAALSEPAAATVSLLLGRQLAAFGEQCSGYKAQVSRATVHILNGCG